MLPKHGERRDLLRSERYDRPSFAWIGEEEWQRRQWEREDRIFAKRANQGELCAPTILSDSLGGVKGVQSQADGRFYDSKSNLRRHYREAGVIEVGNDVPKTRFFHGDKPLADPMKDRAQDAAIGKALARAGLPPV